MEGFFGGHSPPGGFDTVDIAICTIEKANSIMNKLLEQKKLDSIGMCVYVYVCLVILFYLCSLPFVHCFQV